jgi:rRNA maturation endonuclease Nob1
MMVSLIATVKQITLTCVGCGRAVTVADVAESVRNQTCESCGATLINRRLRGTSA